MSTGKREERRGFFVVLLVVAVVVWGYNLRLLFAGAASEGPDASPGQAMPPPPRAPEAASTVRGAYEGDFRDPFAPPSLARPAPPPPAPAREAPGLAPAEPPPLRLSGVVGETAIVGGRERYRLRGTGGGAGGGRPAQGGAFGLGRLRVRGAALRSKATGLGPS